MPKNRGGFVDVRPLIEQGFQEYNSQVLAGKYPLEENSYHMSAEEHKKFLDMFK
jgi:ketopantoate hydroxymethyltransferase